MTNSFDIIAWLEGDDDQPVGEYPDVSPTSIQAFEALDSLCQELEDLKAENVLLKAQLETARNQLHTANALADRRGW